MEIKIVNPNASSLHLAFGITEQRSDELADHMTKVDAFCYHAADSNYSERLKLIAAFCDNLEELHWCLITDTKYLMLKGRMP